MPVESQETQTNQETIEAIASGNLMYLPDLTDPNTIDPNEQVLPLTQQPSGFINTQSFFSSLSADEFSNFAPDPVVASFTQLQRALAQTDNPAAVFLNRSLYPDYLNFFVFMTTGKLVTQQDSVNQIKTLRSLSLSPEDQLLTLPAATIGFAVTNRSGGKDGVNPINDFQLFLKLLTKDGINGTFSPLCAQYDSLTQPDGAIFAHGLLDNIAQEHILRTMQWQNALSLIHRLKHGRAQQLWSTIKGDKQHIHSIVPKVVRQYGEQNQLVKMLLLIDRHFHELQNLADTHHQDIMVTDLKQAEATTESTLATLFGDNWFSLSIRDLETTIYDLEPNESDLNADDQLKLQLARLAVHFAYPAIARFAGQHQLTANLFEKKTDDLNDDLANLSQDELSEWFYYRGFSSFDQAKTFLSSIRSTLIHQGKIGPAADSIHEVVLYFTMGAFAAGKNLVVIGLDIDHDDWMTIAWKFGYNHQLNRPVNVAAPIVYARSPDTGKTAADNAGLSFDQVYLKTRQTNGDGVQPLSTIHLREYFCL